MRAATFRPSSRRTAAALLTLTVAAATATACTHPTTGTATTQHPTPPASSGSAAGPHSTAAAPAPVKSDEDQARQTVYDIQNAYNTQNWDAYTELMCAALRAKFTGVIMDAVKRDRIRNGTVVIKSISITINGDDANAVIDGVSEGLGPNRIPFALKREDGWKVCVLN